ncbi:MAG: response regulator [Treponema sp.]|jgi:DNA-binding response OmpR family regulator|nr:response regulator [Treponema sp.]
MGNDLKKILLVDDSEIHLVIAENILKREYDVTSVKSGAEALGLLSKGLVPNLILLDILMPDMDGWETYNKIKGISLLQNVPIAFLTSLDGIREKLYASRIGAADLITKPYEGEDLLNRIKGLLEKPEVAA